MTRRGPVVQLDPAERSPCGQERQPPAFTLARLVRQLGVEFEVGKRFGAHVGREVAVAEVEVGDGLIHGLRAAEGIVHGDAPVPNIEQSLIMAGPPIRWVGPHVGYFTVEETVEPAYGVHQRRKNFPPRSLGPGGAVVQHESGQPIERLAQRNAASTRVQQVIGGGGELFGEQLPHSTAAVGPGDRSPEAVSVSPGTIEVQIAVIGVAELVGDEVIVIPLPRVLEVLLP